MEPCYQSILFALATSGKEQGTLFIPCINARGFQAILGVRNWLTKRVKKSQLIPLAQFSTESAEDPTFVMASLALLPSRKKAHFGCVARSKLIW